MKNLVTALLLISTASPVFAKIGDSMEQSQKRYGKPINQSGDFNKTFRTKNLEINEGYLNGECSNLVITKLNHTSFTIDEILAIIQINFPKERQDLYFNGKVFMNCQDIAGAATLITINGNSILIGNSEDGKIKAQTITIFSRKFLEGLAELSRARG